MAALTGTIVATSIPTIIRELPGPASHSTWIVAATVLGNTASTPIWGKLGDLLSPKRVFLVAVGVFVVGSILAGFVQTTSQLVALRAVQGIGIGGMLSLVAVIIASLVAPRQRGRINGWLTSVQTTATIIGPVVGGVVAQVPGLGWRWCFFLVLPLSLASIVLVAWRLRLGARDRGDRRLRIDIGGALLIGTGVASLLIAVTTLGSEGPGITLLVSGGYGILAITAAVIVELRVAEPVVPLRLLARRTPLIAVIAAFFVGSTLFGGTVFITQYLQLGLGLTPAASGLLMVPMAVGTVFTALGFGRFLSRTGRIRPVMITGVGILVGGNVLLASLPLAPIPLALAGTILVASGLGGLTQNLVLTAQNAVPSREVGAVSASVMFFFFLGGACGLVALGAVQTARVAALQAAGSSVAEAYSVATPQIFVVSAIALVPAVVALALLPGDRLRTLSQ